METEKIKTNKLIKAWIELHGELENDHQRFCQLVCQKLIFKGCCSLGEFESDQLPMKRLKRLVKKRPPVHFNEEHQIDGVAGLTLREGPHRLVGQKVPIFAPSAWEAIQVPFLIGAEVQVQSACVINKTPVGLKVGPMGYETSHEELFISFLPQEAWTPDRLYGAGAWSHFIDGSEAAEAYLDQNPDHLAMPLAKGYQLSRGVFAGLYPLFAH